MKHAPQQRELRATPRRLTMRAGVELAAELLRTRVALDRANARIRELEPLEDDNEHLRRVIASLRGGSRG